MKRLEQLPEITDEMLGGLQGTQELKNDILRDAQLIARGEKVRRNTPWKDAAQNRAHRARALRAVGALACALVIAVGVMIGAPGLLGKPAGSDPLIDTQSAGDPLPLSGGQSVALDMPRGSIVISQRSKPAYRGVWEAAEGANFPLVCVDGRWYRMMSSPAALGAELTGERIGAVDTFTSEPALAQGGVISNVVPEGEAVYAVKGMNGAVVAANVNSALRVFQRVSYGNSALKGKETLADTLGGVQTIALELTGVGTVTDPAAAQKLFDILLKNAQLERAGGSETAQSLLIGLKNGLVLQMSVRDESLMACGTWVCPEFFEAFKNEIK